MWTKGLEEGALGAPARPAVVRLRERAVQKRGWPSSWWLESARYCTRSRRGSHWALLLDQGSFSPSTVFAFYPPPLTYRVLPLTPQANASSPQPPEAATRATLPSPYRSLRAVHRRIRTACTNMSTSVNLKFSLKINNDWLGEILFNLEIFEISEEFNVCRFNDKFNNFKLSLQCMG